MVSVRLRGRPWVAVLADMIEGVVVANGLAPPQADRLRADLWSAVGVGAVTDSDRPGSDRTDHVDRADRRVDSRVA